MEFSKEEQIYAAVINEAWNNVEFKEELVANPVPAIEKLTGRELNIPEGKTLVVNDQTSGDMVYINIHARQKLEDVELNEEQLEAVAGGMVMENSDGTGCFMPYNPFGELFKPEISPYDGSQK